MKTRGTRLNCQSKSQNFGRKGKITQYTKIGKEVLRTKITDKTKLIYYSFIYISNTNKK